MAFYDDLQNIATGLLTTFQQGTLLLRVATAGSGPAYNPGPTQYSDGTPFNGTVRGINEKHLKMSDGSSVRILATDLVVTMPGTLSPKLTDLVSIGGVDHQIVKLEGKPATGTAVVWTAVVRK